MVHEKKEVWYASGNRYIFVYFDSLNIIPWGEFHDHMWILRYLKYKILGITLKTKKKSFFINFVYKIIQHFDLIQK